MAFHQFQITCTLVISCFALFRLRFLPTKPPELFETYSKTKVSRMDKTTRRKSLAQKTATNPGVGPSSAWTWSAFLDTFPIKPQKRKQGLFHGISMNFIEQNVYLLETYKTPIGSAELYGNQKVQLNLTPGNFPVFFCCRGQHPMLPYQ